MQFPRRWADRTPEVILALLGFGRPFGIAGLLLAAPASAIVPVALMHLRLNHLKSSFHNQS